MKKIIAMLFGIIIIAEAAYPTNRYIDYTTGNDTNAGTIDAPWKNITKADTAAVVKVGDTILYKRGETWDNAVVGFTLSLRTGVSYGAYGTGAAPILTKAGSVASTTSKTGILVRDISFINTGTGAVMTFNGNCDSIQVRNCTFSGASFGIRCGSSAQIDHFTADSLTVTCTTAADGISLWTGRQTGLTETVSISNVTINGGGIYVKNCQNVTISNCRLTGSPSSAAAAGVQVDSCLGTVAISDVDVYNALGTSYYFRRNAGITSLTATRCNAHNSAGHGFAVEATPRSSFVDCVVDTTTGASKHGWYLSQSSNATTFLRCTAKRFTGSGIGFFVASSDSLTADDCTVCDINSVGVYLEYTSAYHIWQNILVRSVAGDGFSCRADVHDITFYRCWADSCGNKTTTDDGDAFTCHNRNYNINILSSIGSNNTCTGVAMVDSSAGTIYNCTFVNNAGDWSAEGGGKLNQVRGGCYINTIAKNPTSGTSWVVKNCIFKNNYPVEVYLNAKSKDLVTMDYNCYLERTTGNFATLNSASTVIDWATYASREAHSIHADPIFNAESRNDYGLSLTSPCIGRGLMSIVPALDYDGIGRQYGPYIGAKKKKMYIK